MSKKNRRKFSPEFKAKVGLEALKGIEPIHAIAARSEAIPFLKPLMSFLNEETILRPFG